MSYNFWTEIGNSVHSDIFECVITPATSYVISIAVYYELQRWSVCLLLAMKGLGTLHKIRFQDLQKVIFQISREIDFGFIVSNLHNRIVFDQRF